MFKQSFVHDQEHTCTWSKTVFEAQRGLYLIMMKDKTSSESNYVFDDDQRDSWWCSNTVLYLINDILVHDQRPYLKFNKTCIWSWSKTRLHRDKIMSLMMIKDIVEDVQRQFCTWSRTYLYMIKDRIWSSTRTVFDHDQKQDFIGDQIMSLMTIKDIVEDIQRQFCTWLTTYLYIKLCLWWWSKT